MAAVCRIASSVASTGTGGTLFGKVSAADTTLIAEKAMLTVQ